MPFLLPVKVTAKLPMSRFKNLEELSKESTDFLLQKRKKAFRSAGKKLYRIVTRDRQSGYRFMVAKSDDLEHMKAHEWSYLVHALPRLIPPTLDPKERMHWLIAHFTQLFLEQSASNSSAKGDQKNGAGYSASAGGDMSDLDVQSDDESRLGMSASATNLQHAQDAFSAIPARRAVSEPNQHAQSDDGEDRSSDERHSGLIRRGRARRSGHKRRSSAEMERLQENEPLEDEEDVRTLRQFIRGRRALAVLAAANFVLVLCGFDWRAVLVIMNGLVLTLLYFASTPAPPSSSLSPSVSPSSSGVSPPVSPGHARRRSSQFSREANLLKQAAAHNVAALNVHASPQQPRRALAQTPQQLYAAAQQQGPGQLFPPGAVQPGQGSPQMPSRSPKLQPLVQSASRSNMNMLSPPLSARSNLSTPVNVAPGRRPSGPRSEDEDSSASETDRHAQVARAAEAPKQKGAQQDRKQLQQQQQQSAGLETDAQLLKPNITIARSTNPGDENGNGMDPSSWTQVPGESFHVRVGPNYAKFGRKEPSIGTMYDTLGLDVYSTPRKIQHIARFLQLPKFEHEEHMPIPSVFVVNCAIPDYAPVMWGGPEDGAGYQLIFLFVLSPATRAYFLRQAGISVSASSSSSATAASSNSHSQSNALNGQQLSRPHTPGPSSSSSRQTPGGSPSQSPFITPGTSPQTPLLGGHGHSSHAHGHRATQSLSALPQPSAPLMLGAGSEGHGHEPLTPSGGAYSTLETVRERGSSGNRSSSSLMSPAAASKSLSGAGSATPSHKPRGSLPSASLLGTLLASRGGGGSGGEGSQQTAGGAGSSSGNSLSLASPRGDSKSSLDHNSTAGDGKEGQGSLGPEPSMTAVNLFKRFVEASDGDDMRKRFKVITRVVNTHEVEFNRVVSALVTKYNGKPFLAKTTTTFYRGEGYFEVDMDVHRFSYMARVGLSGIKEQLKPLILDYAFVIQGESDDELPEQVVGALRLAKLDTSNLHEWPIADAE